MDTPLKVLESVWGLCDRVLGELVTEKDATVQPITLRHPYVFYLGHLPAFTWQQVRLAMPYVAAVNEQYEVVFLRGIDPDVDDPSKCHDHPDVPDTWPAWTEVLHFRDQVRGRLRKVVEDVPPRILRIIAEHDAMHAETLCYMLAQGAAGRKPRKLPSASRQTTKSEWRQVGGGEVDLGCSDEGLGFNDFRWDNEVGVEKVTVPSFEVRQQAVTVEEFAKFIAAGGYTMQTLWEPDDWAWVTRTGRKQPSSMRRNQQGNGWQVLTIHGPMEGTEQWPVYVSLAEARAYANWTGERLPTEAEWQLYARRSGNHEVNELPHDVHKGTISECGVVGAMGNGWELTESVFRGFPGFSAMREYPQYSADFFDGRHFVLKGASNASHSLLCRPSFRNFYQARYPYVFAKFRLVRERE